MVAERAGGRQNSDSGVRKVIQGTNAREAPLAYVTFITYITYFTTASLAPLA
jgi:hypothetical protein